MKKYVNPKFSIFGQSELKIMYDLKEGSDVELDMDEEDEEAEQ